MQSTIQINDEGSNASTFLAQCERLRSNVPSVDTVDAVFEAIPPRIGYGFPLGQALMNNTFVAHVDLNPSTFFVTGSRSNPAEAAPMLRYLGTNAALRTVALDHYYFAEEDDRPTTHALAGQMLVAAGQNQTIESVYLRAKLAAVDFTKFLQSTNAKRVMILEERVMDGFLGTESEQRRIVNAFASNQSLEDFFLMTTETSGILADQILTQLGSHRLLLKLTLQVRAEHRPAVELHGLSSLLRSTSCLQTLVVEHTNIDAATAKAFFGALKTNSTVTNLSMPGCKFADAATAHELIGFVRSDANRESSALRALDMTVWSHFPGRTFHETTIQEVIPSMLSNSALERFKLGGSYETVALQLMEGLVANASTIRLRELRLDSTAFEEAGLEVLGRFLILTHTLQTLLVDRINEECNGVMILDALRQNASLHQVTMYRGYVHTSLFYPSRAKDGGGILRAKYQAAHVVGGTGAR